MKKPLPVCTGDTCSTDASGTRPAPSVTGKTLEIEVYSDFVCPWCPVGEARLEKALALLGPDVSARVTFRPFELNPGLPKGGADRKAHLTAKFGSWAAYERLSAGVVAAAKSEGIDFHLERIERTPNTRDAHRLAWLAEQLGKQPAVVDGLFRAYFEEGRDIGHAEVLRDVATAAGLERERVERLLASDEGLAEVLALEERSRRLGIDGVPCFVVGGVPVLAGAQAPEDMASALRRAIGHA